MFFIGSLEAASQEAFYGKARDVSKLFDCLGPQKYLFIFQTVLILTMCKIRGTGFTSVGLSLNTDVIPALCSLAIAFFFSSFLLLKTTGKGNTD